MIMDMAKKIVEFLGREVGKRVEQKHKLLKLLKLVGLGELKKDVQSVYAHALVEYAVDANPAELTLLFAQKEVQQAFQANKEDEFAEILEKILNSGKIPLVRHIYKSAADLKPEIERFHAFYKKYAHQSADAITLMQHNDTQHMLMQLWEETEKKSFDYQVEQYLKRLKEEFQKKFLAKNHYIDLNGEIRKEIKRDLLDAEDALKEKKLERAKERGLEEPEEGMDYKPVVYRPLDTFIHQWLRDDNANFLVILGEYGTGKTTFLQHLSHQLALYRLEQSTKKKVPDEKTRNFDKIRRLIESSKKSKIILTVRREYFQSATDIEDVYRHKDKRNYSFVHLLPFDDDQIQQFLKTHTDDPEFYWKQIKEVFDLHDLAKRPVLLQLIVDYLPKVINEKGKDKIIKASDLYEICLKEELRRKSSELELIIPNKYREEILEKLAVWLFLNDSLGFDTGFVEIKDLLRRYFKIEQEWEYEKYLNEFLTFTFLIREADYRYRISHKSFRDYLTARSFVREINTG
jgi:hypothetical protein